MLDKDSLNNEISVGVTFASLMAAISLFFTGAIVAQYHSFGPTIKVPMLFLIVSTFSFIFAATIYSNAGSEVTLGKLKTVEKYMIYSTNIVEFLGLYPLIIATPLVIGAITEDGFLRLSTTIVALIGMTLYSQSRFSILEKQLPDYHKMLYSTLLVAETILLYFSQALQPVENLPFYTLSAIILLITLLIPAIYFSVRSNQYRVVYVRPFRSTDVASLARLSGRSADQLARSKRRRAKNAADLRLDENDIRKLAETQEIFVALHGNARVGYVTLHKDTITMVLTDPDLQRKGVGRMLVDRVESAAGELGYDTVRAIAVAPNDRFFKRLGYQATGTDAENRIILEKEF